MTDMFIKTSLTGTKAEGWIKDGGTWHKIGGAAGLTGIGGWAVISDAPTKTYTDSAGMKWNEWTFSADGTLNVTTEGLLDCLVVAGGGAGSAQAGGLRFGGGAGGVVQGLADLTVGAHPVKVGAGGLVALDVTGCGHPSSIGSLAAIGGRGARVNEGWYGSSAGNVGGYFIPGQGHPGAVTPVNQAGDNWYGGGGAGGPGVGDKGGPGVQSSIDGTLRTFAIGGGYLSTTAEPGNGGTANAPGVKGIVIVRRPA